MAYVNLIDLVYPVGSLYLTNSSTTPATTFGGAWSKITGALLSATGYADNRAGQFGGDNTITVQQLPSHTHTGTHNWSTTLKANSEGGENFALTGQTRDNTATFSNWCDYTGGATLLPILLWDECVGAHFLKTMGVLADGFC